MCVRAGGNLETILIVLMSNYRSEGPPERDISSLGATDCGPVAGIFFSRHVAAGSGGGMGRGGGDARVSHTWMAELTFT